MRNAFRGSVLALALATLVACGDDHGGGGVKLDASSDSALNRSLTLMSKDMTEDQRHALQANLSLIRSSVAQTVDTENMGVTEGYKALDEAVKKRVDGMTAADIADAAED